MTLKEDIERLAEVCKPWGFLVFIDELSKWHAWEVFSLAGGLEEGNIFNEGSNSWHTEHKVEDWWVIPAPNRSQALKIAKEDYKRDILRVIGD